jgi:hypothetical protein
MLKRLLLLPLIVGNLTAFGQEASPNGGVLTEIQAAGSTKNKGAGSIFNPNLYDGTATVNIPIFEYNLNGLDLGVSIGYDTHGIRVNQLPSCVGIGWDLSLGGKITRQVQGIEDEVSVYSKKSTQYPYPIPQYMGVWFGDRHAGSGAHIQNESEFDLFTATFAGRSISFTMQVNRDGTYVAKTDPIKNVKIHPYVQKSDASIPSGGNSNFTSSLYFELDKSPDKNQLAFNITDESGNTFVFGWGDYEEKRPNDTCIYYTPMQWNLTDIYTANGQHITYTYGQRDIDYIGSHFQQTLDVLEDIYWASAGGLFIGKNVYNREDKYIRRIGKASYIQKIEYPNGMTLDFEYRTDQLAGYHTYPLRKIIISSNDKLGHVNKRSFEFTHSFLVSAYFNSITATEILYTPGLTLKTMFTGFGLNNSTAERYYDVGTRLNLKEINIIGDDNQTKEKYYSFAYNTTPLPMRFDEGQDYYGYYNGKLKSQSIPANFRPNNVISHTYAPSNLTYGMDKTPDINFAQARVLVQIVNGTGGSIDIKYKDHNLYNPKHGYTGCTHVGVNPPTTVFPTYEMENANDGLCIDEITVRDGFSKDNTIKTKYVFSKGQRFFRGGFSWVPYGSNFPCNETLEGRLYSNNYITPMQFINGSNHGYTYAEVKNYNADETLLGSTKYHYTNLIWDEDSTRSNLLINNNIRFNHYPIDYFYSYRMGKVIDITEFDYAGIMTQKDEFTYSDYFQSHIQSQVAFKSHKNIAKAGLCNVEYWNFTAFPYLTYKNKTTEYLNSAAFTQEIEYRYDQNYDLKTTRWLDENNNLNYSDFTYTRGNGNVHQNLQGLTLNNSTSLVRVVNGNHYLIDKKETEFDPNLKDIKSQTRLYNNTPYIGSDPSSLIEKIEEHTKRDDKGNVVESKIADQVYSATLWDNRIGQKTAIVSNARFEEIAHTSFEGEFQPIGVPDFNRGNWYFQRGNVVHEQPNQTNPPITGQCYYNLSGSDEVYTAFAPTNGKNYILSLWATVMPRVMIGNQYLLFTENTQVGNWRFYTVEFTGSGEMLKVSRHPGSLDPIKLDELRLYPSQATMSTMTHEPLFGISSKSDERGNTIYYEYDPMGRLKVTRDLNRNIISVNRQVVAGTDNY